MSLPGHLATAARTQVLRAWPQALGLWAFGSRVAGHNHADSDLDLALLLPGKADAVQLWQLSAALAQQLGMDVDLLDLRAASTVMAHQVLSTGECLHVLEPAASSWTTFVLNEKLRLDEARAPLMAQIAREGTVHGR